MELVNQVQILDEAAYISFHTNSLEKGMNLSALSTVIGK